MRTLVLSKRNILEMIRDPLSWIFCAGMPVFMMGMFRFILYTIISGFDVPDRMTANEVYEIAVANGTPDFRVLSITPGIAVFSLSFVMLFAAIGFSKDRSSAFLTRLYSSPLKVREYISGYTLPFILVAFMQLIICFAMGFAFGLECSISEFLMCILVILPTALYMIGFGILFGAILNDKASPGICSVIITLAGVASGAWFDVSSSRVFDIICHILPFANSVDCARAAINGDYASMMKPLLIIIIYAVVLAILSILVFSHKMKSDNK